MKKEEVLKSIGERLKKAREAKGLTIDQARIKTRIHLNVLKAFEDGTIDECLSFPYTKGFLKKYSDFLGSNTNELSRESLSLHKGPQTAPAPMPKAVPKERLRAAERPARVYKYLIIITAAIITVSLALHLKHAGQRGPSLRTASVRKSVTKQKPIRPPIAKTLKTTAPAARRGSARPQAKEPAEQSFSIPKGDPIIVTLKVKRKVMIQAAKDGNVLFWQLLREGSHETIRARDRINLAIGKIDDVEILVNGKPLVIHARGPIKDLEITRSGFKIK